MYDDHIKTFAEIRSMLLSEESRSRDIVSFLKGRFLFERGTAEVLCLLTGTGDIRETHRRVRRSVREDFDEYISLIATCLSSHSPDNDASVVYYAALSDVISTLSEKNLSYQTREKALRDLEDIVRRFQSYYAKVMAKYLELQRLCSA